MRGLDRLAKPRHQELCTLLRTERQQRFGRLVPIVHGQRKRAPVHRQERASAEQGVRFEGVDGTKVNVTP